MKTCSICGASNNDDNQFCIGCGQRIETNQPVAAASPVPPPVPPSFTNVPPAQQPSYPPQAPMGPNGQMPGAPGAQPYFYGQPAGSYGYAPVMPDTGRFQRVRDVLASKLMLTASIIILAQVVLAVLTAIFGTASVSGAITSSGINGDQLEIMNQFISSFSTAAIVPAMIPTILTGVGFFLIYRSASNNLSPLNTSGITMIRVITIIQFVFGCIGIGFLLIAGILFLGGGASGLFSDLASKFGESAHAANVADGIVSFIGVVLFVIAIVGGGLMIGFFIIQLKFIGSVRETIRTGIAQEKCAGALSVILFIAGGFSALGLLSTLNTIALNPAIGTLAFITSASNTVYLFVLGILINKYKQAVYS